MIHTIYDLKPRHSKQNDHKNDYNAWIFDFSSLVTHNVCLLKDWRAFGAPEIIILENIDKKHLLFQSVSWLANFFI